MWKRPKSEIQNPKSEIQNLKKSKIWNQKSEKIKNLKSKVQNLKSKKVQNQKSEIKSLKFKIANLNKSKIWNLRALSLAKVLDIKFEVPSCLGSPWPGLNAPGSNRFGRLRTAEDGWGGLVLIIKPSKLNFELWFGLGVAIRSFISLN